MNTPTATIDAPARLAEMPCSAIEIVRQRTATDCLRCCLAMVLGRTYEVIPDFVADHDEMWARELHAWLVPQGMGLIINGGGFEFVPPALPIIALFNGSPAKPGHMVVVAAGEIFDPHTPPIPLLSLNKTFALVRTDWPNAQLSDAKGDRHAW